MSPTEKHVDAEMRNLKFLKKIYFYPIVFKQSVFFSA